MQDLISRQAVIDAIVTWTVEDRPDAEMPTDLVGRINALPSAQPEIIRCKDCSKWQTIDCPFFSQYKSVMPNEEQYCSLAERRTAMSELKPCPFCGGEATLELIEVDEPFTFTDLYYTVICTKCGLRKGRYRIPKLPKFCEAEDTAAKMNAIAEWNRREGEQP